jgi:hypothetical protein
MTWREEIHRRHVWRIVHLAGEDDLRPGAQHVRRGDDARGIVEPPVDAVGQRHHPRTAPMLQAIAEQRGFLIGHQHAGGGAMRDLSSNRRRRFASRRYITRTAGLPARA